jgi:hypothetical protein
MNSGRATALVTKDDSPTREARGHCGRRAALGSTGGAVSTSDCGGASRSNRDVPYLRGSTASFSCLAMRAFTTVLAGILMASPVAGLRPIRALRF